MTIKQLVEMCENIDTDTDNIMIYHSVEDFDYCTSNWNGGKICCLTSSELATEIAKFQIVPYNRTVAVAKA